jgi:hypothetical protein
MVNESSTDAEGGATIGAADGGGAANESSTDSEGGAADGGGAEVPNVGLAALNALTVQHLPRLLHAPIAFEFQEF